MATYFFHEDAMPNGPDDRLKLVRYYYDDISAEILTRSFYVESTSARRKFIDNERFPLADLRPDLKTELTRFLSVRLRKDLRLAS
ncbi:MAG TPA: hypothetical protein VFS39_10345 [Nitrospira sp.]|nr:hypothetical protein [Nitrospira sp.]